ncbi:PAQR family membrane homeostasis protein TrhA [Candidatus Stoquefichus sp. SB1]|uniref:PAQR family membrane homeostasis protein TrhA n=1 Tax=Candidatus Stoquefichus sp. SB1 TaxID=1658109 RepID=UPI00067F163F|nr:hemolysin III family protein [Candidatus Stoquefichus sp. SB1]
MEEKTMRDMLHLTFGEEVGNAVSHGVMALLCLGFLPFSAVYSYLRGGIVRSVGVSIFIICLFLMFLISTIYHSMDYATEQKYVFRKLDHICIYLAIAGSYTPIALCVVKGWVGILILVLEWGAVLAGILLKSISKKSYPVLSTTIYLVMGWTAVFFIQPLLNHASLLFLALIVLGGVMYSAGVFFYSKHKKYFHFIWHLFINVASILHFIAIVFYM